jgi:hypothetical protein
MALAAFIAGFVIVTLILCYERFIKDVFLKRLPFVSILAIGTAVDTAIIFTAMIVTFSMMGFNEESVRILIFGALMLLIQFLSLLNRRRVDSGGEKEKHPGTQSKTNRQEIGRLLFVPTPPKDYHSTRFPAIFVTKGSLGEQ